MQISSCLIFLLRSGVRLFSQNLHVLIVVKEKNGAPAPVFLLRLKIVVLHTLQNKSVTIRHDLLLFGIFTLQEIWWNLEDQDNRWLHFTTIVRQRSFLTREESVEKKQPRSLLKKKNAIVQLKIMSTLTQSYGAGTVDTTTVGRVKLTHTFFKCWQNFWQDELISTLILLCDISALHPIFLESISGYHNFGTDKRNDNGSV